MRRTIMSLVSLCTAIFVLASASVVRAEPPAVLSVISVRVKGDGSAYMKKLQEVKPILLRLGAKSVRVFRVAYGGEETGRILSVSEYENAEAFGKFRQKRTDDDAFKAWFSDLQKNELTDGVQATLLEEVTP